MHEIGVELQKSRLEWQKIGHEWLKIFSRFVKNACLFRFLTLIFCKNISVF